MSDDQFFVPEDYEMDAGGDDALGGDDLVNLLEDPDVVDNAVEDMTNTRPPILNLAKKEKLVQKAVSHIHSRYKSFTGRSAWDKLKDDNALADRMLRVSQTKGSEHSSQQANTLSNVTSTGYLRRVEVVSAGEQALFFDGDDLPAKYVPRPAGEMGNNDVSRSQTDNANLLEQYTFLADERQQKIEDLIYWHNGYGNYVAEMGWETKTETVKVRRPIEFEERPSEDGEDMIQVPIAFEFAEETRVVKDCPSLRVWPADRVIADTTLPDLACQQVVVVEDEATYSELRALADAGEYENVDKLTTQMMSRSQRESDETREERQEQADESSDVYDANGTFPIYHIWARLPVEEPDEQIVSGRRDATLWDAKKNVPNLFHMVVAGDLPSNANTACLLFERNRLPIDEIPLRHIHSHRDNKGLLHDGYTQRSGCLYETECTLWNMGIDNIHLGIKRPFIAEFGQLISTDLNFDDGNKIIYVKPYSSSTALKQLDISDMTGTIGPFMARVEEQWDLVFNTQDNVRGEALGARATATEAQGVLTQAMKPALMKARYFGNQLFPWMLRWDAKLWEYFGDPETELQVTHKGLTRTVKPAEVGAGDFDVRVTAIDQFESDVMSRAEEDQFIQTIWPIFAPLAGKPGQLTYLQRILKRRKYDISGLFQNNVDGDARIVAESESLAILQNGVEDYPNPDENHAVHLEVHEAEHRKAKLLPPDVQDPQFLKMHAMHIEMTKQMQQAADMQQAQAAQQQQMPAQQVAPAASAGQQAGATLGGMGGGNV
jgi:hypothetical protein